MQALIEEEQNLLTEVEPEYDDQQTVVRVMSRPQATANLIAALHTLYLKQMNKSFTHVNDISAQLYAQGQIDLLDRNFQKMGDQVKVFLQIKQSKQVQSLNKINLLCI